VVLLSQAAATPLLSVTPPNQNVTGIAGTTTFNVASNAPWSVTSNAGWCTVTPSGTGNGQITADYETNPLLTPRIATITVTVNGMIPVSVTVSQAGGAVTLSIDPHSQSVDFQTGSVIYTVTSNSPWTASCDMPWCTITPSGNGNGIITANYLANPDAANRIATITVTVAGMVPATATLSQAAAPASLQVTPPVQNVAMPAGTITFNVVSNANWNASSNVSWCSATPFGTGNGVITAYYDENTGPVIRTANIIVSVAGVSPQTVQVIQLPSFVSISDNPETGLQIFPNPTSGIFVISNPSKTNLQLNVSLLDITGKTVLTRQCSGESTYTFDLTSTPKGNYYIKADYGGRTLVWKLILN
jgi:hypothetical protein